MGAGKGCPTATAARRGWGAGRGHAIRRNPRRSEGRARVDRQQAGLNVLVAGRGQGGTRIIYDLKFLLECKNSPTARRPPCCLPQIPGVTAPPTAPPPKLEELTEQKETEEEIPDDEQFGMDI
ncbi:eukaryotic translation initiation factor 4E-binding protein 3 [Bubalus bubalis]|uniref:eukaryotic translation initiation factor 4E-binding protein 3 n=1 Tax=Bubalus bubalis TaxID=89462 RepID=UPI001D10CF83|nr:eukaryotic translation initiation factor 4E-binding protein 3 [Bubalus bubalis]